jgi:hypothetical protein
MQSSLPFSDRSNAALAVREVPLRTRQLMAQRDKLLRRISKQQAELARLEEGAREGQAKVARDGLPLLQEIGPLSQRVAQMFEALLADPARSKRQRSTIRSIYKDLVDSGLLDAASFNVLAGTAGDAGATDGEVADEEPPPVVTASAKASPSQTVRSLFRRLADALHPDKVQDEDEKARRTELMKQVTQAYGASDFASLLAIEQAHGHAPAATQDDPEAIDRELTLGNAQLRKQVRELDKQLRSVRDLGVELLDAMLAELKELVDMLRATHEHVAAFRDKKITFDQFCDGPPGFGDDVEGPSQDDLSELVDQMIREFGGPARARRRKQRRRR